MTSQNAPKQMSFAAAMKDYFGYRPMADGQTGNAASFMAELRALSDDDKAWFRAELPKVGYEVVSAAA